VTIHALELLHAELNGPSPELRLRVHCSKGTYIRTLGEDIAKALGCGGHLSMLRRIQTGPFSVSQSVSLAELEALDESQRLSKLLPVAELLPEHQTVTLNAHEAGRFLSGLRRRGQWPDASRVAVWGDRPRAFLGTAHIRAGELIPERLLTPIEIQTILEVMSS
jgi:tRNA pseudouridine55 synthase